MDKILFNLVEHGDLSLIKRFYTLHPNIVTGINSDNFSYFCSLGNLSIVQWIYSVCPHIDISADDEEIFLSTCASGHLSIAKWLLATKPNIAITNNKETIFASACASGNLDLVIWLLAVEPQIAISADQDNPFIRACANGHEHIAKWLLATKPDINITSSNNLAFSLACSRGYFNIAKWLWSINSNSIKNIDLSEPIKNIDLSEPFKNACELGRLDIAKWLYEINPNIKINWTFLFDTCCDRGHFEIVKWLYSIIDIIHYENAFDGACIYGHIEIAKWLLSIKPEIINRIKKGVQWPLITISEQSNITVVEWIYSINPNVNNKIINKAFANSCYNGLKNIAQWLYSIRPNISFLSEYNYYSHPNVIQWIYQINSEIVIANINSGFDQAITAGNIQVVQWIYSLKPYLVVPTKNWDPFVTACYYGYVEIAKWLCTLNNCYHLIVEANQIISYWTELPLPINPEKFILISSIDLQDQTCPICWHRVVELQTNCIHSFCTECITYCYKNTNINCAYCRSIVTDFYQIK